MSKLYECPRCGYTTKYKHLILDHAKRQKPCNPVLKDISMVEVEVYINGQQNRKPVECEHCHKTFASVQSLKNHLRYVCKSQNSPLCGKNALAQICEIQAKQTQLEKSLNALSGKEHGVPSTTHVIASDSSTVNLQQTSINQHITINAFGKENIQHISQHFLDKCIKRTNKGFIELIENIHFHPETPQNANLRITNKKLPYIEYHNGEKWQYGHKSKVIDDIVDNGNFIVQNHFDDNSDRLQNEWNESMYEHVIDWLKKMHEKDKETLRPIVSDLYLQILNKST